MNPVANHSNDPRNPDVKRQAFTLIELLASITIIAILAALLFPALGRGKQSALRIHCLSNLQQMAIASHIYTEDRAGFYPIAYYAETRQGVNYSMAWDLSTSSGATPEVEPGLLWQGQSLKQIQQCPSFRGNANWLVDPYTGYNYNTSYIGHGQFESVPQSAKAVAVLRPVATVIFGDGQYAAGANKFMRAPWPNPGDQGFKGRWGGTQGFRHGRRSNTAFCDGHAESMKMRFTQNKDGARNVASGTGFLSSDNDLYDLD